MKKAAGRNSQSGFGRSDLLIVAAIFVTALVLRLYGLGTYPIWWDEAASIGFIKSTWADLFGVFSQVETNPPGYYALLKAWTGLFGSSQTLLRFPSALFGALTIIPVYALAARFVNRETAILASLLLAATAIHVEFSQTARTYALFVLITALSLFLVAEAFSAGRRARTTWITAGLLGVSAAAMLHLHFMAFVSFFAVDVYAISLIIMGGSAWNIRSYLPLLFANLLAALLSYDVLIDLFALLQDNQLNISYLAVPSLTDATSVYWFTFGFPHLFSIRHLATALLAGAFLSGVYFSIRQRSNHISSLSIAFIAVLVVVFLISQFRPILVDRALLFALPLPVLVASFGAHELYRTIPRLSLAFGLVLFAFFGLSLFNYYGRQQSDRYPEVASALETEAPSGTPILFSNEFDLIGTEYYLPSAESNWTLFVATRPISLQSAVVSKLTSARLIDTDNSCELLGANDDLFVIRRRNLPDDWFSSTTGLTSTLARVRQLGNHLLEHHQSLRCGTLSDQSASP